MRSSFIDMDRRSLHSLSTLLAELEDLKRQQPAHYRRSIASTLFVESWKRLLRGEDVRSVAMRITAQALINVLLPGCDAHFLQQADLSRSDATQMFQQSLRGSIHGRIDPDLYEQLSSYIPGLVDEYFDESAGRVGLLDESFSERAWFVEVLCRQPRAGATKPGTPRLLLIPPEMHSDHCLVTAVFAVLLSPSFCASPEKPFMAGLSHHLHNAVLPDCGFAGEMLLEPWLAGIMRRACTRALAGLPPDLVHTVQEGLATHEAIETAEGRAASAADVIDRVLDVQWRTRAANVKDEDILSELELVHAGPLKQFQTELLAEAGLWE